MRALPYWLAYLIPTVVVGYVGGGWWTFLTAVSVYVLIPPLDAALGTDPRNPAEETGISDAPGYKLAAWLAAPVHVGLVVWALWVVDTEPLTTVELIGFTLSVGITGGAFAITAAHELIHRRVAFERTLAMVLMGAASYAHFCVEHVHGHHRHVGTPSDPATPRRGESVYAFWPRETGRWCAGSSGSALRNGASTPRKASSSSNPSSMTASSRPCAPSATGASPSSTGRWTK